eukprot:gb/GECH01007014.1/.p1 GENE.gb/GECH01007014.1/~~gb/GECH01007014.1/.p1  ORF type:complete len:437 (+),score=149.07 gb/GECH01007014.1/:1-1311(+)
MFAARVFAELEEIQSRYNFTWKELYTGDSEIEVSGSIQMLLPTHLPYVMEKIRQRRKKEIAEEANRKTTKKEMRKWRRGLDPGDDIPSNVKEDISVTFIINALYPFEVPRITLYNRTFYLENVRTEVRQTLEQRLGKPLLLNAISLIKKRFMKMLKSEHKKRFSSPPKIEISEYPFELSPELFKKIFTYLDGIYLWNSISRVCRAWYVLSKENSVWEELVIHTFGYVDDYLIEKYNHNYSRLYRKVLFTPYNHKILERIQNDVIFQTLDASKGEHENNLLDMQIKFAQELSEREMLNKNRTSSHNLHPIENNNIDESDVEFEVIEDDSEDEEYENSQNLAENYQNEEEEEEYEIIEEVEEEEEEEDEDDEEEANDGDDEFEAPDDENDNEQVDKDKDKDKEKSDYDQETEVGSKRTQENNSGTNGSEPPSKKRRVE